MRRWAWLLLVVLLIPAGARAEAAPPAPIPVKVRMDMRIPMRDGVMLAATGYLPRGGKAAPCIFTLTPYTGVAYHDRGMWFAGHGLPFLTVDVRGRGDSGGAFTPNLQEADDGHDVVRWLARQPFCNGRVSMWGGSYAGYDQWATASRRPPALATIVPVASPKIGVDFPIARGMIDPYARQWLALTWGRAAQTPLFADGSFWAGLARERFERGGANAEIVDLLGTTSPVMARWFERREDRAFWASHNPTTAEYAAMTFPILTITGAYDADQPGALAHYRDHVAAAGTKADHYLVIGPWNHAGTRTPTPSFDGLTVGAASLVDLPQLHLDWYRWTMAGGPRPAFLKDRVAYYVTGAEEWRYAPSLDAVTASRRDLALGSDGDATDALRPGRLGGAAGTASDRFVYDPRDTRDAALDADTDPWNNTDQRLVLARTGRQVVYTTPPLETTTEVAGAFRLDAWISIDQPDTSLRATVYAILPDGRSIRLGSDRIRARYREDDFAPRAVPANTPLLWRFDRFPFTARRLDPGTRLRLVIDPMNSVWVEKNYNAGKRPETETMADARVVTITLHHDPLHPSILSVPIGR